MINLIPTQVDAGNIYGDNLMRQHQLRLHKDGKLKYQVYMCMNTGRHFSSAHIF